MNERHEGVSPRAMRHACAGALLALLGAILSAACGSGSSAPGGGTAGAPSAGTNGSAGSAGSATSAESGGSGAVVGEGGATGALLPNCEPVYTSCNGLCGPVSDPCSGQQLDCGICPPDMACDRDSHRCVAPQLTCADLGAECGRVRNTCGVRLECGDCPAGEECDPDRNTCVTCSEPSCVDLGFECGSAWLGCGPPTQVTHCGDCAAGTVCNVAFNRCEPAPAASGGQCVPKTSKELCTAANADCGYISDGCGGTVKCGDCPKGSSCATGGIANRCGPLEQPWQCALEERDCGKTSGTCGGKQYDCGACTKPEVCNENGKCGPPCTPALPPEASNVACGTFDDGCKGKVSKTCPVSEQGAQPVCTADGSCCTPKTCAVDYAGQCGSALPDGCGATLKCGCAAGSACSSTVSGVPGTCCELPACDGQCNVTLSNACGSRACKCAAGQACDAVSQTCCVLPKCNGACGTTVSNDCGSVTCTCAAAAICGADHTCCTPRTCASFYSGKCGSKLDDGCGGTIDCACSGAGKMCTSAVANTPGKCCTKGTCSGRCGAVDDGCGGQLDCGPC
jgi:hypothetical protein